MFDFDIELYRMSHDDILDIAADAYQKVYVPMARDRVSDGGDFHRWLEKRNHIFRLVKMGDRVSLENAVSATIPAADRATQIYKCNGKVGMHEVIQFLCDGGDAKGYFKAGDALFVQRITLGNMTGTIAKLLQELAINGLKHDDAVRQGVTLSKRVEGHQEQFSPIKWYEDEQILNIHPVQWCRRTIAVIDYFYFDRTRKNLLLAGTKDAHFRKFAEELMAMHLYALNTVLIILGLRKGILVHED